MNPKISIVMPTWNAAFVLNQTIDSIFEQSEENFEAIIVDDGSTDSTKSILSEINDSRFKIITLDSRKGAGNARNIGNKLASTPIIIVLDCGDILYSNKLSETLAFFDKNPTIDIMCSATDCLSGDPSITPRLFTGTPGEKLGFEHPGVAYKKSVTEKIKYRTTSIETDQYDAFFFEAHKSGFSFGIYTTPLSSKCTFTQYDGGRNLDKALLVKLNIYREFGIKVPDWLEKHELKMKGIQQ